VPLIRLLRLLALLLLLHHLQAELLGVVLEDVL
jgi:hypothetical protein